MWDFFIWDLEWVGFINDQILYVFIGFDVVWEIDIWGKICCDVQFVNVNLNVNVVFYDDVLVILIGDIVVIYIIVWELQQLIVLVCKNVVL